MFPKEVESSENSNKNQKSNDKKGMKWTNLNLMNWIEEQRDWTRNTESMNQLINESSAAEFLQLGSDTIWNGTRLKKRGTLAREAIERRWEELGGN